MNNRAHTYSMLKGMLCCLLVALLSGQMARGDDAVQRKFLLDEANMKMASARAPKEFGAAAATYQKLVDSGVHNGDLFYNLGTARLLAEEYDEAGQNLLRAERYAGSNWEIRRNLLIAIAGKSRDRDASLPWYRSLLFWHFALSGATRWGIAVCSFFVFWLGLSLQTLGSKRLAKIVIVISFAGFVVFGSSVATSLREEQSAESSRGAKILP